MYNWKRKRILVTGSTGFVGKHLVSRLTSLGAEVYGISRSAKKKNKFQINVAEFSSVEKIIKSKKIDICFHLAAEALVESGNSDPFNTFKNNIAGALNVLECARIYNLEKVIIASTSHVYGDRKPPYLERFSPRPSRPYETSKTCIDLIAQSYANTFALPVLIPRFVNIYGPGDLNFNRLIPKTIKNVLAGRQPEMWGGEVRRDYLYIDDALTAYVRLCEVDISKIGKNRIFNFGSDNVVPVREVIQKIINTSGKNLKIKKISDQRKLEIGIQFSSWKKAKKILKWSPVFSIDEGLLQTVEWYRQNSPQYGSK